MTRLFAALSLPADARSALHGWAAGAVGDDPAVRVLPVASLHVTLVFLGSVDDATVPAIAAATAAAARMLPPLSVAGAAWLPPRRPGVLVADLALPDELAALHGALVAALSPWHEPEARAFRPHVTVGRVRRGARPRTPGVPPPPALTFAADALVLYRSHIGRGGASYEALASAPV